MNFANVILLAFVNIHLLKQSTCLDYTLARAYLKKKYLKAATIFVCSNSREQVRIAKLLNKDNFFTSVYDINKNRYGNDSCRVDEQKIIALIVDGDCERFSSFLAVCDRKPVFSYRQHWLIFSVRQHTDLLFENVALNVNSNVKIAVKTNKSHVVLKDVYNPAYGKGGSLNVTDAGYFTSKGGFVLYDELLDVFTRRKNMSGVTFNVTTALPRAFEGSLEDHLFKDDDRDVNSFNRHQSRLLTFCADFYNFSLNFRQTKSWGYVTESGRFDGLVGDLQNKTVDFGGSPLFFKLDRLPFVDYGRRTWFLRVAFIFREPEPNTPFLIFLRPLSSSVWICTLAFFLFVLAVLKVAMKIENTAGKPKNLDDSWSSVIVLSVGMFCQQGSAMVPTLFCGRITTFSMFFFSLLFIQFYSGSIISYLLRTQETGIKTVADILHSSLQVGCDDIIYNKDYFKKLNNPVEVQLYRKKMVNKNGTVRLYTQENGIKLVAKGNFAFHVELLNIYPLIERTFPPKHICQLREVQMFKTSQVFTTFPKGSPFRKTINYCLNIIGERGILQRQIDHWSSRKPKCLLDTLISFKEVSIEQFYPALIVLIIGMCGSCTLLLFERKSAAKKKNLRD